MANTRDLWPADISETSMVPPVAILREQASLLGRKTQQLLRARVETSSDSGFINHAFIISAPAIDYSLELFTMWHQIELYPIQTRWQGNTGEISDENQLIDYLKMVFGSKDTKKIIHSLLAQVRAEQGPTDSAAASAETAITDEDIPF